MSIPARSLIVATALSASLALAQRSSSQNSPYTATEKSAVVQTLSDGTHINVESVNFTARDSAGRTLRKTELPFGLGQSSMTQSTVYDPVARTNTFWTSMNKQATRMHMPDLPMRPQMGTTALGSVGSVSMVSAGIVSSSVVQGPSAAFVAPTTAVDPRKRPETRTEKLGGQTIAGVYAEGTKHTTTYPIGSFGNDRPVVSVNEIWTSPDLHIIIRSVSNDPRSGTRTTEVISLDRAEPDPALFQPPPGYEIKDQNQP